MHGPRNSITIIFMIEFKLQLPDNLGFDVQILLLKMGQLGCRQHQNITGLTCEFHCIDEQFLDVALCMVAFTMAADRQTDRQTVLIHMQYCSPHT